jgi:ABC-type multidrug transport system ATPase subunit
MFPETIRLDELSEDVREFMLERLRRDPPQHPKTDESLFEDLVDKMGLRPFLDLPLIALSNGQTRRARILKAVLSKPSLLLLDEPLSECSDVNH